MIRFTTGVMGSGKTEMITSLSADEKDTINNKNILNYSIIVFSASKESGGYIESRSGRKAVCNSIDLLDDYIEFAKDKKATYHKYIIDEAQFLTEEQIEQIIDADTELHNVDFHLFGLLTNFKGNIFTSINALLPYVEVIESIPKVCDMCENKLAIRNIRVDKNSNLILDGEEKDLDKDKYITVCKTCYTKMHNKCQRKE